MTINSLKYGHNNPGRCDGCVEPHVELSQIIFKSGIQIVLCRGCVAESSMALEMVRKELEKP